ncbi:MAG: GatB/YqeY domain-containing protein [Acidimicrobiales bacterium]|nr:GatB/YqeY domain-containing protein [Acidimicrobiales bacterium]RZV47786.1 MAG: GatB/YqeY domain-containing protein [Acidimicrobiales bacterium]
MGLADTIQEDLVAAMKAGDDVKKTTLRAVLTAIKTAQTAEGADETISDDAVQKLIATEVKQRTEAAEIFAEAGESEREAVEVAERAVLQTYLPEPLSPEELEAIVAQVIADGGYTTKKDMGSAIKEVMAKAGGRADGKTVSGAVGKALS